MSAASGSPDLVEALSLPGLSEIDLDVEPARDPPRAAELDQSAEEPLAKQKFPVLTHYESHKRSCP